jgi:hypothetical protein
LHKAEELAADLQHLTEVVAVGRLVLDLVKPLQDRLLLVSDIMAGAEILRLTFKAVEVGLVQWEGISLLVQVVSAVTEDLQQLQAQPLFMQLAAVAVQIVEQLAELADQELAVMVVHQLQPELVLLVRASLRAHLILVQAVVGVLGKILYQVTVALE